MEDVRISMICAGISMGYLRTSLTYVGRPVKDIRISMKYAAISVKGSGITVTY